MNPKNETAKFGAAETDTRAPWVQNLRYTKSFLAKLCLSGKDVKETYAALFNALSSFDGVTAKTSFSCATFSYKRKPLARISLSGKSLTIYFAIDPATHAEGRYRLSPSSAAKKNALLPSKFRIKSQKGLAFALRVIKEVAESFSLKEKEHPLPPVTAKSFPASSIPVLLSRGLIRQIGAKRNVITVEKENLIYVETEKKVPGETIEELEKGAGGAEGAENAEGESVEEGSAVVEGEALNPIFFATEQNAHADDIFADTAATNVALTERHGKYVEILNSFTGEGEIRFVRRSVIRAIDERWVTAIEDCLLALDEVTRSPSHFIEETEELLPIERTKKVTTRSIKHLCQHTGLISRIEKGVVIPSKLLNVFRDESVMTYENKFVNTLLLRLFSFVTARYEEALEYGANRHACVFSFTDKIESDEEKGKISFEIELSTPTEEREKTRFFQSDLWARVKKLNEVITDYQSSEFCAQMGNAVIKPPVVHTNPILKNKNLRQCLDLWEFLEGYDDEGVTTKERDLVIQEEQADLVRRSLAEQYVFFRHFSDTAIRNEDEPERVVTQKAYGAAKRAEEQEEAAVTEIVRDAEPEENEIAFYVSVALAAEELAENEAKEAIEEIEKEREDLLEEEAPEEAIKSAVDTLPVEYPTTEPKEEETSAPAPESAPEVADEQGEESESDEEDEANEEKILFVKSFSAKLASASDFIKDAYCRLANALLSKEGVKERKAFDHIDFYRSRKTIARVSLIGKTLRVYFALDPASLDGKYGVTDRSSVKKFEQTPSLLKVKGPRSLKRALELCDLATEDLEAAKKPVTVASTDFKEMTTEEALAAGEIRRRVFKGQASEEFRPRKRKVVREKIDWSEEVAEYNKEREKANKKEKEKTVVLDLVSPAEYLRAVEKAEEEEIQKQIEEAPAVEKPHIAEGGAGDPLFLREEAELSAPVALEEPKQPEAEEVKPAPKPVPVGGDELKPKPITMEELEGNSRGANRHNQRSNAASEQTRKGFFSRLFGRKNKR